MKKLFILFIVFLLNSSIIVAKPAISVKFETAFLSFFNTRFQVDPGPGWKGNYLNNGQNAIAFDAALGFKFFNGRLFVGAGAGYQNFEGYHGAMLFGDVELIPLKTRFTPLAGIRLGRHHLWNQYTGGTATTFGELGGGIGYRLNDKIGLYAKTGVLLTQQSSLIPFRFGLRCKL